MKRYNANYHWTYHQWRVFVCELKKVRDDPQYAGIIYFFLRCWFRLPFNKSLYTVLHTASPSSRVFLFHQFKTLWFEFTTRRGETNCSKCRHLCRRRVEPEKVDALLRQFVKTVKLPFIKTDLRNRFNSNLQTI